MHLRLLLLLRNQVHLQDEEVSWGWQAPNLDQMAPSLFLVPILDPQPVWAGWVRDQVGEATLEVNHLLQEGEVEVWRVWGCRVLLVHHRVHLLLFWILNLPR